MNALPLISELSDRGIIATVDGSDLTLDAPKGALTTKLVSCLREDKQDVITWLGKLRNVLGEDWQEVSSDPAQLKAAADSLMTIITRKWNIVPDHYNSTTNCRNCGEVPIWLGCPPKVTACPWCMGGQSVPNHE